MLPGVDATEGAAERRLAPKHLVASHRFLAAPKRPRFALLSDLVWLAIKAICLRRLRRSSSHLYLCCSLFLYLAQVSAWFCIVSPLVVLIMCSWLFCTFIDVYSCTVAHYPKPQSQLLQPPDLSWGFLVSGIGCVAEAV